MDFESDFEGSSFYDLITKKYPKHFPGIRFSDEKINVKDLSQMIPYGTTILAIKYSNGVIICGDRRATEGHQISSRDIEKVYKTDNHSAIAIAGAAGPCIEMVRLFRTELEHYEKLEGVELSTEGKANKLSQMIKANLPFAMQGLIVIPIFVGYDIKREEGRIFKYDVTGGRYEEIEFHATGSGGKDAKNTIKSLYEKNMDRDKTLKIALESIYNAADEDAGTGGADFIRGIFPIVKAITKDEISDISNEEIKEIYSGIIDKRKRERGN